MLQVTLLGRMNKIQGGRDWGSRLRQVEQMQKDI